MVGKDPIDHLGFDTPFYATKGVCIAGVERLRKTMVDNGLADRQFFVSSGFNQHKIPDFVSANRLFKEKYGVPLFTFIGTGSVGKPVMTTSDIVAYFNEQRGWKPWSKAGRAEILNDNLKK